MLAWFASAQHADGSIPASPIFGGSLVLFDYNAYWLITLHDYVLYSGDLGLARDCWPSAVRLIDGFYASRTKPSGLLANDLGPYDYGYIRRRGDVVAYYNAQYAYALNDAVELAKWVGDAAHAAAWSARERAVAASFTSAFWDDTTGAFSDTTADRGTHPEDGNSFAVLSGLASPGQAARALDYLWSAMRRDYGNTIVDNESWDGADWGYESNLRVYPFMTYFEVQARFATDDDARAFDLIRREWGYMVASGPGTMWELIGPYGGQPTDRTPSFDAGWSSGAAPALTQYVLGVTPTSPGFRTFTVNPHLGDLRFASGDVPTPHGLIHVSWEQTDADLLLRVVAPPGTTWENQPRLRRNRMLG
jgi:glycogen debranching enzyme